MMVPIRWGSSLLIGGLVLLFVLVGGVGPGTASAQHPVDVAAAHDYAQSLGQNFWAQAWVRHLEAEASRNGTIDWHYADRRQLGALTDDYQQAIRAANGFWTNLQVQDYLQRQLLAVQPHPMMPGRPGAFRLQVLSTTTPNALALNDGTILVTTGLLTTLRTEAQLRAVLAHEVAHVVLDHSLSGYRSSQKRNRARKVLGTIIGGVTSVVTPTLGGPAPVESTVYGLSTDLATQYLDREFIAAAGLEYNQTQEAAAVRLAQEWLLAHDEPPAALYTALQALRRDSRTSGTAHGASFVDSHPLSADLKSSLSPLIEEAGGRPSVLDAPPPSPDLTYDTALAAVLEHEAEMDLAARRFYNAHGVLDRALRTDWTTPRTFLFKAIAVRNTTTTGAADEALRLLDDAEQRTQHPEPRIEAERALLRIREGNPAQARRHLARCRQQIEEIRADASPADSLTSVHDSLYTWAEKLEMRLRE